jgi:hypothetical protein
MERLGLLRLAGITALAIGMSAGTATAQAQPRRYSATLVPGQENPSLATPGVGTIILDIDADSQEIRYLLAFNDLSGVTQAHIHFEKPGANGPIMLWLCKTESNQGPTPATTPNCPAPGAAVTGTLVPSDVRGLPAQGLGAGDFANAVAQIRNGLTYANVHTTAFPGGQIRGQILQGGARP